MTTEKIFANKHVARFIATLTLYSSEIQEGKSLKNICESIKKSYKEKDLFAESDKLYKQFDYHEIDEVFLTQLIDLIQNNNNEIIEVISSSLIEKYNYDRLDRVIKSVLRLATAEILYSGEIAAKIIIDEYVSIIKSFYENNEAGFVNKVIDVIARKHRKGEISE